MAFQFIHPSRNTPNKSAVRLLVHKQGKYLPQLSFCFTADFMKSQKWMVGDRLEVAFDDQNPLLVFFRRSPNGFKLVSIKPNSQGKTNIPTTLKMSMRAGMPFKVRDYFEANEIKEYDGGIIFNFDKN